MAFYLFYQVLQLYTEKPKVYEDYYLYSGRRKGDALLPGNSEPLLTVSL